jgi:zinc D-Ala-D-Ala carboxypeptidase
MSLKNEEDIRLAKNFTLNELIKSSTADRMGINNWPEDDHHIVNLTNVANHILQPVRDEFGATRINSGYRSPKLNKAVSGEAADFECSKVGNFTLAQWVANNLDFDQLILEFYEQGKPSSGWVHCSYKSDGTNRKKIMTALRVNGKTVYKEGLIK